jgi:endoglucanase
MTGKPLFNIHDKGGTDLNTNPSNSSAKWKKTFAALLSSVLITSSCYGLLNQPQTAEAADGTYNYAEALQKSILFYEAQRSGKLPADNRISWRGDSGLKDGADVGKDLTGGWYDAGDHVKFGLPMAATASMLAWSVYEYRDAYVQSGQLEEILDNIKWATDYFIKAHTAPNEFYGQVGHGGKDHAWWGPAEVMQMERPSFKIDAAHPGSDLAGQTAAALAISSIIFKETDPAYSTTLLKHAKELYTFADTYRGKYSESITDAQTYYNSWSGYQDELTWGATWLYLATNDTAYLNKAIASTNDWGNDGQTPYWGYKWTISWDDFHYGAQLLLARITGDAKYVASTERNLDFWTTGFNGERVKYTPGGLAWLDSWGALRYSANASFLAFVYSDWVTDQAKKTKYRDFAVSQVKYMLGDNPRNSSYVIGFGNNSPQRPHHRTAHGSYADSQLVPGAHRHLLYGALVGGPDATDAYVDDIGNYVTNEVATDYNAGFTGALAKMYSLFGQGQQPLPNFPPAEVATEDEFFVEAGINTAGETFTEIKAQLNNRSAWPARMGDKLSFKYFVDLSELYAAGYTAKDVTISTNYNQGATVSALKAWDEAAHIYYTNVDFTGTLIYPGGQSAYKKEVQFRLAGPLNTRIWNAANDYSYKNLTSSFVKTAYMPVYDNGVKIFGSEPSPSVPTAPAAPAGLAAAAGDAKVTLSWSSVSNANSYTVKRGTAAAGPFTAVAAGLTAPAYTDTAVVNGSTYYYVVSASNAVGESPNSTTVSAKPVDGALLPGALSLTAAADTSKITLGWTASANAAAYDVKRGTAAAGPFTALATGLTATAYTDTTAAAGTTYYYVVTATNAAGSTSSNVASAKVEGGTGTPGNLVVQYKAADTNAGDNQMKPHFQIVNNGTTPVALSGLKLRYYYTIDGEKGQTFNCDYAVVGCSKLAGALVKLPAAKTGADYYLEVSFSSTAGTLAAGSSTGEMQIRINKTDWTNFNEADDYSFDATKTGFADWNKVTLYQDGALVWGIEP